MKPLDLRRPAPHRIRQWVALADLPRFYPNSRIAQSTAIARPPQRLGQRIARGRIALPPPRRNLTAPSFVDATKSTDSEK